MSVPSGTVGTAKKLGATVSASGYGHASEVPRRATPPTMKRHRVLQAFIDHTLLIVVAAIFMVPLVFILATSFMTQRQALTSSLIPDPF